MEMSRKFLALWQRELFDFLNSFHVA